MIGSILQNLIHPGEMISWYLDYSRYLNVIHIIYFLFPLIIIILLSLFYSRAIFISLWYYFIMLFIFYSKSYWKCPIIFLLEKIYGYDGIPKIFFILAIILQIFVFYLFAKGIQYGRRIIKENGLKYKEKIIIWYILLLPVFLRF